MIPGFCRESPAGRPRAPRRMADETATPLDPRRWCSLVAGSGRLGSESLHTGSPHFSSGHELPRTDGPGFGRADRARGRADPRATELFHRSRMFERHHGVLLRRSGRELSIRHRVLLRRGMLRNPGFCPVRFDEESVPLRHWELSALPGAQRMHPWRLLHHRHAMRCAVWNL